MARLMGERGIDEIKQSDFENVEIVCDQNLTLRAKGLVDLRPIEAQNNGFPTLFGAADDFRATFADT